MSDDRANRRTGDPSAGPSHLDVGVPDGPSASPPLLIAVGAVAAIVAVAAGEVDGVAGVGGATVRGEGHVVQIELDVVVRYDVAIAVLAGALRGVVVTAVREMTGLVVDRLDVAVVDVEPPPTAVGARHQQPAR